MRISVLSCIISVYIKDEVFHYMYKIAVCDDDDIFAQFLKKKILTCCNEMQVNVSISVFHNALELIQSADPLFHLFFLDIRMPGITGIELARWIRQKNNTCFIIFVSSIHEAVYESIQYAPLRFIRKEYLDTELSDALHAFHSRMKKIPSDIMVSVSTATGNYSLPLSTIMYIEALGHQLIFHCTNQKIQTRERLSEIETKLSRYHFTRVHRGYIVNFKHITHIKNKVIHMSDGSELPNGRTYHSVFTVSFP